jgi:hypothetical protein
MPFWFPLLFGVVFSGVGFGLMFAALYGGKFLRRQQRLQAEHPTEPWLWRKDWAQGRAESKTRTNMLAGWVFAIFWNAISAPIALLVFPAAAKQKGAVAYLILFFPLIGIFLLIHAIRETIAFFEFGKTYFEMSSVPGVIGRELKGQIQARFPHSPDHGVHLRLSCVHRVTVNSGDSRSTTETIVWREEADLSSGQLCPGPAGTTIPVQFRIPLEAQPTEKRSSSDEIVWILEALADVPGVNYHDIFEVPVFRTQETPSQAEAEKEVASEFAKTGQPPAISTVQIRQTGEGTEFYFPAARNKKFAVSATVMCLAFGGIAFLCMRVRAPIIFPIVFSLFWLVLVYVVIRLWLWTSRVVIGGGNLSLQAGLLGGGKVHQIPLAEIASIGDKIGAQQGGGTGTTYYDIELALRDGTKLTLGRILEDKHEVEWLVQEMKRLVRPQQKRMIAGMS